MAYSRYRDEQGPVEWLDRCADWGIEDCTSAWARAQEWCCFACGRSLTPAGDTIVHLVPPGQWAQPVPVVVHADCAVAFVRSGRTLGDWLKRIRHDPRTYDEGQIARAFQTLMEKRGLLVGPVDSRVGADVDREVGEDVEVEADGDVDAEVDSEVDSEVDEDLDGDADGE